MASYHVFNGNEQESLALAQAISTNCIQSIENRPCGPACSAHGLMRDQGTLDRLVFMRRQMAVQLRIEEHDFDYVHRRQDRHC